MSTNNDNNTNVNSDITEEDIENIEYSQDVLQQGVKSSKRWSRISVAVSVLSIGSVLFLASGTGQLQELTNKCTTALAEAAEPSNAPSVAKDISSLGAYENWLSLGNTGSPEDFIDSLKGEDGLSVSGLSAYQIWLKAGNVGSEQDFIDSLSGDDGISGNNGLDAYDSWLQAGNSGTVSDFLLSLRGDSGSQGTAGLSAYQVWLIDNPNKTVNDFIKAITGPAGDTGSTGSVGPQGEAGICTVGDTGPQGIQGVQGLTGAAGINGLNGIDGLPGAVGPAGPQGPQGPAGASANVAFGSWISEATQTAVAGETTRMFFEVPMLAKGVRAEVGADGKVSDIVFENDGIYNVQFSAQLHNKGGAGSGNTVTIWLGQNGRDVPMSATNVTVNSNNPWSVASWNFFVEAKAGDTAQLFWMNDKDSLAIVATTANSVPGIPSLIVTVHQVG